jgi:hypothetical protein
VDQACEPVEIPPNAQLNMRGDGWVCTEGFKRSGQECTPMTPEEHARELRLKRVLEQAAQRRRAASSPCDFAYNGCVSLCSGSEFYDYARGVNVPADETDYPRKCNSACTRGRRSCKEGPPDDRCKAFDRACRGACPSGAYHYGSGNHIETDRSCEDACRSGAHRCGSW